LKPEWSPVVEVKVLLMLRFKLFLFQELRLSSKFLKTILNYYFIRSCGYFVQNRWISYHIHSFPDANGVYELTGTGFVSGDVLSGNGY
jgi:hypothetical protein